MTRLLHPINRWALLRPHEWRVAVRAARAGKIEQVAADLGLATGTVKGVLYKVYGKLKVRNRLELILLVREDWY